MPDADDVGAAEAAAVLVGVPKGHIGRNRDAGNVAVDWIEGDIFDQVNLMLITSFADISADFFGMGESDSGNILEMRGHS